MVGERKVKPPSKESLLLKAKEVLLLKTHGGTDGARNHGSLTKQDDYRYVAIPWRICYFCILCGNNSFEFLLMQCIIDISITHCCKRTQYAAVITALN